MTGGLWIVDKGYWQMAVLLYVLAALGFSAVIFFMISPLPGVALEKKLIMSHLWDSEWVI
ncbi:MAG: hypothetical protein Ct9H300mP28_34090 [Pseudomonadota bacterium]|nr:MAG: hypothetical protein Ct9H300mP28_34090 [Pseudomonadota bacterium]